MSEQFSQLTEQIGKTRRSDWLLVDQSMIGRFADVTLDRQFIHVDPERAAETPFGGPIAHGFLVLSMLSYLQGSITDLGSLDAKMGVNYGFDRIRFISPVRAGKRVRLASTLVSVDEKRTLVLQLTHDVTVEIEGEDKPALKASWISQLLL